MSEQTVDLPIWWEGENTARADNGKDKDLISMLTELFEHAREAQKPYAAKWRKFDNFYRGKQWERQVEKWRAQITVNVCFPTIENQLAVMADSSMRASMMPVEGGDAYTARALDSLLQYSFSNREWPLEFTMGQKTSMKYGGMAFKISWDPDLGLSGDVGLTRLSPKTFIPDPMAKTLEEARYVFEAKILTLAEIKRLHPKKGGLVKPDAGLKMVDEREQDKHEIKEVETYNKPVLTQDEEYGAADATQGIRDMLSKALYVECWMKDESYKTVTEEVEEEETYTDEDGEVKLRTKKVKEKRRVRLYPGGRHICFSGNVILKDEKNPFWHLQWPYAILPNYPDDENFWGISEIENIISLQLEINKRRSQVSDNASAHGNSVWIKDTLSGIKTADLGPKPNLVVTTRTGGKCERVAPTAIPEYIVNADRTSIQDTEYVTGTHEILQGRQPGSVRDFSALRAVQEIAERRIVMKLTFHQAVIRRIGRLASALYMQYYDTERWKRILGKTNVENLIKQRLAEDPSLNVDEDMKPVADELAFGLDEVYEMYDYRPESEPMTRNTRQMNRDQLKELYTLMAGNPKLAELLLKAYNIDEADVIAQQIPGQEQAQVQQQAPPPPGPQQLALPEALPEMPPEQVPPLPPPGAEQIPPELIQQMMAATGGAGQPF